MMLIGVVYVVSCLYFLNILWARQIDRFTNLQTHFSNSLVSLHNFKKILYSLIIFCPSYLYELLFLFFTLVSFPSLSCMFCTISEAYALIFKMASESNLIWISYTTLLNVVFNFKSFILIPRFPLIFQRAS